MYSPTNRPIGDENSNYSIGIASKTVFVFGSDMLFLTVVYLFGNTGQRSDKTVFPLGQNEEYNK